MKSKLPNWPNPAQTLDSVSYLKKTHRKTLFKKKRLWILTESCRSLISLGAMTKRARKICNAWEVGREHTRWTHD